MREAIVIPKKGENSEQYYSEKISINTRHYMKLNEYIKNNNLPFSGSESTYLQGIALSLREYCVLVIDSYDVIIYLPMKITEEQYDWFNKYREKITKLSINIVSIEYKNGDYDYKHINNHNPSVEATDTLYKELNRKLINEKEVDINGNKRSK